MSQTEIRRFFDAVAADGPPADIDVDAAMSTGRRRRRRRTATVALSSAAVLAVVGVVVATALPDRAAQRPTGHPSPSPSAGRPSESPPSLAGQGSLVTSTDQLLGTWWALELDRQPVEDVRDRNGDPLVVSFRHRKGPASWNANDGCNANFGRVSVSTDGRFVSKGHGATLVACPGLTTYDANWRAIADADQARIVPAGGAPAKRLVLQQGQRVLGVYVFVPEAHERLGYGTVLTSGPGNGDGMAAEVRGRLTMGKDDCLGLDGSTAVFPQGTTWSGALGLLILPDGTTAHLGDVLSGGGGYLEPGFARTWVEDKDMRGICTWSADVPVFNKGSAIAVDT